MPLFSRIFGRDGEAKRKKQEQAAKEEKAAKKLQRRSRSELQQREAQNSATTLSSEGRTSSPEAVDMLKIRSSGSNSTFLSSKGMSSTSIDYLPKLDLGNSPPAVAYIKPSTPSPPLPQTLARGASTVQVRPTPSPIQPGQYSASHSRHSSAEWDAYLASRKVAVAKPEVKRASRTVSLLSPTLPALSGARISSEDDDDDDVPLAAVAALRSRSSPSLPRPATFYSLSPPSPSIRPHASSSTSALVPPRSGSRASLTMPAILAQPVSPPLPSSSSFAHPRTLGEIGRRNTLIDLSAPSTFDPYLNKKRQDQELAKDAERIVVGERRKTSPTVGAKRQSEKGRESGPKIMDFGELEERHKKRLSVMQGSANDKVATDAARAYYTDRQREEAEAQRRREARRSVDSNLHLLGTKGRSSSPTETKEKEARRRASASVGSLSGLLKREQSSKSDEDIPLQHLPRGVSSTTIDSARPRPRRSFTEAVGSHSASTSRTRPPFLRDTRIRRHSLGTLLEVSHDQADIVDKIEEISLEDAEVASPRIAKVKEWRRQSLVKPVASQPSSSSSRSVEALAAGAGEAVALQKEAAKVPAKPAKKAHDWLSY
ncbi:hypothetical protein NBRC10512_006664 [Rhodotorula toruloides]|uniref:RHTO0S07e04874g1_1 n=2 Tax=Rhodotorula toruloides TaxID=5286 RepID=A0A061B043_RHOTO|nr:uncharacterized protein RHTO_02869 [Rhodotorula toruloides NP11]EMS25141.1 hypothetical protein RHTO_02869 [Rhodotorula toruloides NP11]CDR42859.1 RHTO0S07e04874g1_1 [Rhodotorula toruloides]